MPKCLLCKHFETEGQRCAAHPEGLEDDIITESMFLVPGDECAKGIKYEPEVN